MVANNGETREGRDNTNKNITARLTSLDKETKDVNPLRAALCFNALCPLVVMMHKYSPGKSTRQCCIHAFMLTLRNC